MSSKASIRTRSRKCKAPVIIMDYTRIELGANNSQLEVKTPDYIKV